MSTGMRLKLFKVGSCVHPGFMVRPGLGWRPKAFPAAVALIEHPQHGRILFDTGYHQNFFEATKRYPEKLYSLLTPCSLSCGDGIVEQLSLLGTSPEEINHLVLSHFHADHIAALSEFTRANLLCHPLGYRYMKQAGRLSRLRKGYLRELLKGVELSRFNWVDKFPLDLANILGLDTDIGLLACDAFSDQSLYFVNLPGHAAGQIGLLVRLEQQFVFLLADACWVIENISESLDQHWLANILCDDVSAYRDTLNKLRKCYSLASDKVIFMPSHCMTSLTPLINAGWLS